MKITRKIIKEVLKKEPLIIEWLCTEDQKVAKAYFIEEMDLKKIEKEILKNTRDAPVFVKHLKQKILNCCIMLTYHRVRKSQ